MRVREGTSTAGIWFYQTTPAADRAFVGMYDDDTLGLYGSTGAGWGLLMDTTTGNVGIDTGTPVARLHIVNGTDSEPSGGGFREALLVLRGGVHLVHLDRGKLVQRHGHEVAVWFGSGRPLGAHRWNREPEQKQAGCTRGDQSAAEPRVVGT
jgi:hypothetical protein